MEISEHDDNDDYMQLMEDTYLKKNEQPVTQHLKLDLSDSFLSCIRLMLAWHKNGSSQIRHIDRTKFEEFETAQNPLIHATNGKQVPTELPLRVLYIEGKLFTRTPECDIFARFFYLTKKIACQMRMGTLSRKSEISFSDITALHVCFEHTEFDTLIILAKVSFKSLSADNTVPGNYSDWKAEDTKDAHSFPNKSKIAILMIDKGMLETGFAKLLYTDPRLKCIVNFSRGIFSHQSIHDSGVNGQMQITNMSAQMQVTNMSAIHSLLSNIAFPQLDQRVTMQTMNQITRHIQHFG